MIEWNRSNRRLTIGTSVAIAAAAIAWAMLAFPGLGAAEETHLEAAPPPAGMQMATFAGGCFWSMQAIFQQLKGVEKVDPGYSGGTAAHPSYNEVETGTTGYAESVNIVFDPNTISYDELLKVLLIARNPTTVNQQGPDVGTNYRSVIFYRNAQQKSDAEQTIRKIDAEHIWSAPIVTQVEPFTTFWRAESYHFNYYALHPNQPYCAEVIAPEIANFRRLFRNELK